MQLKLLVGAGDGIGPEVTREAVRILVSVAEFGGYDFQFTEMPIGGTRHPPDRHALAGVDTRRRSGK